MGALLTLQGHSQLPKQQRRFPVHDVMGICRARLVSIKQCNVHIQCCRLGVVGERSQLEQAMKAEAAHLILDAALISFMAALTRWSGSMSVTRVWMIMNPKVLMLLVS